MKQRKKTTTHVSKIRALGRRLTKTSPAFDPSDAQAIDRFVEDVAATTEKIAVSVGADRSHPVSYRTSLLRVVGEILTVERVAEILQTFELDEKRKRIDRLLEEILKALRNRLFVEESRRRGPKSDPSLEAKIYRLVVAGKTFAQIYEMRIAPHLSEEGIRTAFRRYKKKLEVLWPRLRKLQYGLAKVSIMPKEQTKS